MSVVYKNFITNITIYRESYRPKNSGGKINQFSPILGGHYKVPQIDSGQLSMSVYLTIISEKIVNIQLQI